MLQKILINVVKELDKNKIPYAIIGGQASLMHGVVRFTQDIDIVLGIAIDEINKFQKLISKLNFEYLVENPEDFAKLTRVMPVYEKESNIKIDFIFSFTDFERNAIENSIIKEFRNTQIHFCSAEDLIIFKIFAGRELDIFDVKNIFLRSRC